MDQVQHIVDRLIRERALKQEALLREYLGPNPTDELLAQYEIITNNGGVQGIISYIEQEGRELVGFLPNFPPSASALVKKSKRLVNKTEGGMEEWYSYSTEDEIRLVHLIMKMREYGSSLVMNWGEGGSWEVSWITGGERFVGVATRLLAALHIAYAKGTE